MFSTNFAICGKKKSAFIKNQEFSDDYFKMNKTIKKTFIDWRQIYARIATETDRIYL